MKRILFKFYLNFIIYHFLVHLTTFPLLQNSYFPPNNYSKLFPKHSSAHKSFYDSLVTITETQDTLP